MIKPCLTKLSAAGKRYRLFLWPKPQAAKNERMKKYLSEKNALTVMVSIFCFVMMIISFVKEQSLWQSIAFALAFSFSVEIICHRAKENS